MAPAPQRAVTTVMAFNSRVHVVRTYGRHKKRTITAWISPNTDSKTQHIFSSPENYSFTTASTVSTDSHSTALTNSSDDKSGCLHSDEEWIPGRRAGPQAKKALQERNVVSAQSKKKPATRKVSTRTQVNGKENHVEWSTETVEDLPPTARGKRVTKLSRKKRGRGDVRSCSQEDKGTATINPGSHNPKNVVARFDLTHSPIERSSQSSSKQERTESSDVNFDTSCDLFNYSADVSDPGSCSNDKAGLQSSQKPTLDDSVFRSPMLFSHPRQKCYDHGCVETSTPKDPRNFPKKTPKVHVHENLVLDLSTKRVTRSSLQETKLNGKLPKVPVKTDSPVFISTEQATGDLHKANCRCLPCKTRRLKTPDLFDITNEISLLDLNNTNDRDSKPRRFENNDSRCASASKVISPCSVVVTPLSRDCLSRYSTSLVLSSQKEDFEEIEEEGDEGREDEKIQKSTTLGTPNSSRLSDRYLHSFKEVMTPVKSKRTGQLITARQKVLQQCDQAAPVTFSQSIPLAMMKGCVKIGEGVYGEVFRTVNTRDETVALKIIPIQGDFQVNGEPQKSFEEILPEIVISRELSALKDRSSCTSATGGFITVNDVSCCYGCYPKMLLDQWDEYNTRKDSENDRPDIFPNDQLFIVFEFADGGIDLESKRLDKVHQAVSIFQQVAMSLAVAEQSLEFEHRDLHWGNILVLPTSKKTISFQLEGEEIKVASHGVQAGMIDFTLSRLKKDDCTVYCDLSNDETLFTGRGDPQFDVYRKMRDENDNDWDPWNPHTNVMWLHYLVDKLLNSKTYPRAKRDPAQSSLRRELRTLCRHLLGYSSAIEVVRESGLLEL